MTVKTIRAPLFGERVIKVEPPLAPQVDASWRKRLHLFSGRALTDSALSAEQAERGGRLALRGQLGSPGVVTGLEASLERTLQAGRASFNLHVTPGLGLCASGEDVVISVARQVDIRQLPVYFSRDDLQALLRRGHDILGQSSTPVGEVSQSLLNQLEAPVDENDVVAPPQTLRLAPSLSSLLALSDPAANASAVTFPLLFVVVLQPVQAEQIGNFNPADPCEQDPENDPFDDLQIVDGCRLVLFHLPWDMVERNRTVYEVFAAERTRPADQIAPWEYIGVPIGLLSIADPAFGPAPAPPPRAETYLDRAAVVRVGGKAIPRSPLPGVRPPGSPMLWQARIDQFAEQLVQNLSDQSLSQVLEQINEGVPDGPGVSFDLRTDITWLVTFDAGISLRRDSNSDPRFALLATDTQTVKTRSEITTAAQRGGDGFQVRQDQLIFKLRLPPGKPRLWVTHHDFAKAHRCTVRALDLSFLPPVGLLHRGAVDLLQTQTSEQTTTRTPTNLFFPEQFLIDALPVPQDELDSLLDASASLDPLDTAAIEFVRVLVPVPPELFEPALLKVEPVDPAFLATLNRLITERGLWLRRRELLRATLSSINKTITGNGLTFPDPDPSALEQPEDVARDLPPGERVDGPYKVAQFASLNDEQKTSDKILPAAFNADGSLVVTGGADGFPRIWSVHSGRLRILLGKLGVQSHSGGVEAVAFTPIKVNSSTPDIGSHNGHLVVSAGVDRTAKIWDPSGDPTKPLVTLGVDGNVQGHSGTISSVAIGVVPNTLGKTIRVITGSFDRNAIIWEWDREQNLIRRRGALSHSGSAAINVSMTPDGAFAVSTGGDNAAMLWGDKPKPPNDFTFNRLQHIRPSGTPPNVFSAHFSQAKIQLSSGEPVWLVVTTASDGTVNVWNAETAAIVASLGPPLSPVADADFSPDGRYIAIRDLGLNVKVWDWRSRPNQPLFTATLTDNGNGFIQRVAFSPDGMQILAVDGARARIFDARTGALLATLDHKNTLTAVGFSPDGYFLFTAGTDNLVKLWAVQNELSDLWTFLRDDTALKTADLDQVDAIGLQGLADQLSAVIQDANSKIDIGFLRVQTDIYRIRQIMLNSSAATRLATSPSLAEIAAKGESAVAERTDVQNLLARLQKQTPGNA